MSTPRHLRYKMTEAPAHHPQVVMRELRITYQHATPQTIADQWWFWNCDNVPDELPVYLEPLDLDPLQAVGNGLTLQEAQAITECAPENLKTPAPLGVWQPIDTAPKDGTPFLWLHWITVVHVDKPATYVPSVDILRRAWINEETAGRQGDGFWMGQYGSKSDDEVYRGYWMPLPQPPTHNSCH